MMDILYVGSTGQTLYATVERVSDGYWWDATNGQWAENPTEADRHVSLTEGGAGYAGSYTATIDGLGDAGWVRVRVHTGDGGTVVGAAEAYIVNGEEYPGALMSAIQSVRDSVVGSSTIATIVDATTLDVTIRRGDDYTADSANGRLNFTLTGYDLSAVEEIWLTIKRSPSDADDEALIQVTYTGGAIEVTDAQGGCIAVELTAAQTASLRPIAYYYDVQVRLDGRISTPIAGIIHVLADVTRAT